MFRTPRVAGYAAAMHLDDQLERTPRGRLLTTSVVSALLPLVAIPWAPLLGDVAAVVCAAALAGGGAWLMRRRSALQSLPLRVAPIALRGDDGLVRVQLWLGRGRPMQQVSLTAKVGAHSVNSGAAGPVVGPWTAVLDLPDGPIEVTASCRSGAREWTASARLETPAGGRFAPAVQGEAGALTWNRSAWGAASASPIDAADQNV